MNPRYPIYIPTKGRWESRLTVRFLENVGVPYKIVVERQEYKKYAAVVDRKNIITLPFRDKGLTATRNWIWDFARDSGVERFWTLDDNIGARLVTHGYTGLFRFYKNMQIPVLTGTPFRIIEDFVDRYENIAIAGMNYFMFVNRKDNPTPFYLNSRVYSNMLLPTDIRSPKTGEPYRNEMDKYNDDTDLNLRVLKDGWCTVLFNAFLVWKRPTMTIKGGMDSLYESDGRWQASEELREKHPDVTKVVWRFHRWHHIVDYSKFRKNKLIRKKGVQRPKEKVDNYGLKLIKL